MTIWGAFSNSVLAMQAQSDALGVISQNVANVNTTGYKSVTDNFQTVLSESSAQNQIFGVQVARQFNTDKQGAFQTTGQWDNLALNGPGFFVLNSSVNGTGNTLFTRAGDFEQTASPFALPKAPLTSNILQNPAVNTISYLTDGKGDYLMGWKATNGIATTSNDLSSLTPVNLSLGSTIAGKATTQITLQGSLPSNVSNASQQAAAAQKISTVLSGTSSSSTFDPTTTQEYNKGTLQIQLGAVNTNTGVFTSSGSAVTVNITDGSLQGIANAINGASAGVTASVVQDSSGNFQLSISGNSTGSVNGFQITGADTGTGGPQSLTSLDYTAANATQNGDNYATASQATDAETGQNAAVESGIPIYDNQFDAQTLTTTFTKTASDIWTVSYSLPPGVGAVTSPASTGVQTTLNFDGAGNFQSQTGPSSVSITWADGSSSTINVDFSKMSQLASGSLQLSQQTQDGFSSATLLKGEFDSAGNLYGDYSNGQKVLLYTVPVATFTAPDSLQNISGTNFQQTAAAGTLSIDKASTLNDTSFVPENVETSNVSLEDQFSRMITTQTAYNSATKVFNVADQMTQSVRDLIT